MMTQLQELSVFPVSLSQGEEKGETDHSERTIQQATDFHLLLLPHVLPLSQTSMQEL